MMATTHLTVVYIHSVPRRCGKTKTDPAGNPVKEKIVPEPTGSTIKYEFSPPPEVLFKPAWKVKPAPFRLRGNIYIGKTDHGAGEAVWLYFKDKILAVVVKNDNLPSDMDSAEKCRCNWPKTVYASEYGVITRGLFLDKRELKGRWHFAFAYFDSVLAGTPDFWDPLYKMDELTDEERKNIKAIAERESPKVRVDSTVKPEIFISPNFLTVFCNAQGHRFNETRKRSRQTDARLRQLFENWKKGNDWLPLADVNPSAPDRPDKIIDKNQCPQTALLICSRTDEKTGKKTVRLSPDYTYTLV